MYARPALCLRDPRSALYGIHSKYSYLGLVALFGEVS